VVGVREGLVDDIWKLASDVAEVRARPPPRAARPSSAADERQNFTARVDDIFRQFQQEVCAAVKEHGWDGRDDTDEAQLQWSYAGALLYAVTVTTTIGMTMIQSTASVCLSVCHKPVLYRQGPRL